MWSRSGSCCRASIWTIDDVLVSVPVVFHPATRLHNPGPGHPERPERIEAVIAALRAPDLTATVEWVEGQSATRDQLERVHSPAYLDALERLARGGGGALDADTVMSRDSWGAALAAAGVATGAEDERGGGNVFSVPRPPGLAPEVYVRDLLAAVDAATVGWRPDLLLVSAGFDSLAGDPLGGFTLGPADVAHWTRAFRTRVAPAPVVGVLEGGYRLDLLAAGACAHVRALA